MALTTCADEPTVPVRPAPDQPRTDAQRAAYLKDLHGAWGDCHDTVGSWAERRKLYEAQYQQENSGVVGKLWQKVHPTKPKVDPAPAPAKP